MTVQTNSIRRFFLHYVEMVTVMFVGMFALGMPADMLLRALGASMHGQHPTRMLATMAFTMTAPMVAWMRYRGHAWRPSVEMAASMVVPTLVVLTLLWTGAVTGVGTLMVIEHAAMLAGMLLVMALRPEEYSGGHAHGDAQPAAA
jgi:hypothetical protein